MLLHMNLWFFFFDFFFDNDINRLLKNLVFVHVCGVDWMYSFNNFYRLHNVYPVWCGNRVSVVIIYLLFLYVKQNNCISLETTTTNLLCLNQQARTIWVVQFLEISKVLSLSMDPLNEVSIFSIFHKSLIRQYLTSPEDFQKGYLKFRCSSFQFQAMEMSSFIIG